jgi:hypothetical protein
MKKNNLVNEIFFGALFGVLGWLYLLFIHEIQISLFKHIPEHFHLNKSFWTISIITLMIGLISLLTYKKGTLSEQNKIFQIGIDNKKFNSIFFFIMLYFFIVLASGAGVGPEASLISAIVMINKYRRSKSKSPINKKANLIHIITIILTIILAFKIDGKESGFYKFNEFIIGQRELVFLPLIILLAIGMIKFFDFIFKKIEIKLTQTKFKKHYLPIIGGTILILTMILTNIPQYAELNINHFLLFSGESGIGEFAQNSAAISPEYGLLVGRLKFLMFSILINTGIKGGAYFPYMFGAFAISYYVSFKLGINFGFTAIIFVTAALSIPNIKQVWLSVALVPLYFAWSSLIIIVPLCVLYSYVGGKMNIGTALKH